MRIVIPDDYQNAIRDLGCFRLLKDHQVTVFTDSPTDPALLAERFAEAEALVLIRERTKITEALLARLPQLKLISQTGKISNHLDLAACTRHGIAVAEGIGSPIAPAELTWALIMNAWRQLPPAFSAMQRGLWQVNIGRALQGHTLGIWGYGKIGRRVARYARAFDMPVLVWGSEISRQAAEADGLSVAGDRTEFFQNADIVTLHLRLTAATQQMVSREDLAAMKPDALFVNTSRAELLAPGALLAALQAGRPGYAAVDVYENEPVRDKDYALLQLPNVLCSPHLGYVERGSYELYFSRAFANVLAFAAGRTEHIVNPEVLG